MARGLAAKGTRKARAPGDVDTDTPEAVQAPALSVLAAAALEYLPTTTPAVDPLTFSQIAVVGSFVCLWFVLFLLYYIMNWMVLGDVALPWSIAALQLITGSTVAILLWTFKLRPTPCLTVNNVKVIAPIAVCHTLSHVCTMFGLGADLSRGYARFQLFALPMEPLFAALFSAIFLKQAFPRLVYVTLVPAGCFIAEFFAYPSDVHWVALGGAIGFNLAASMSAVLFTRSMGMGMDKSMSPANLNAVVTIMTAAMFLPLSISMEGSGFGDPWAAAFDSIDVIDYGTIVGLIVVGGVLLHFSNEVAFRWMILGHPLTHTVASTFKYICLMSCSMVILNDVKLNAQLGSCVTVAGVLLYTLANKKECESLAL